MNLNMTFPVKKLTKILEENKARHQKFVKEAKEAYKKALIVEAQKEIEALKERVEEIEEDEELSPYYFSSQLKAPSDHTQSYTNTIEMFKLTTQEDIELDSQTFAAYVRDKWSWQKDFLSNSVNLSNLGTGGHYYMTSSPSAETVTTAATSGSVCESYYNKLYGDGEDML